MSTDYYSPTAVCNEALDSAALDFFLGDIQEGTRPAQICLRHYSTCRQQLLRGAHWDFARKQAPLQLLADSSGQTEYVGTVVPGTQFMYEYGYPQDCQLLRWIPWHPLQQVGVPTGNITPPDASAPLTTGGQAPYAGHRPRPSRFLVTSDQNYIPPGTTNDLRGVSPVGRTVILSNVQCAQAVYTFDAVYPNLWDSKFRGAMVAYLAAHIALPLAKNKEFGMRMQAQNIGIAQEKIRAARISDGNEGWSSSDIAVDWMRFRAVGGARGAGGYGFGAASWGDGAGMFWGGWDSVGFGNGSSY